MWQPIAVLALLLFAPWGQQRHGDWVVAREVDPIDDAVSWSARVESDDAMLAVVCRDEEALELLVLFEYEYVNESQSVIFRVDRNEPVQWRLRPVFEGSWSRFALDVAPIRPGADAYMSREDVFFASLDRAELLAQARAGTRMAVRAVNAAGLEMTRVFSLAGFSAATAQIFQQCAYDPNPDTLRANYEALEATAREEGYGRVDATIGEEYLAQTRPYAPRIRVYPAPDSADDTYIEEIRVDESEPLQIVRRFKVAGDQSLVPPQFRDRWNDFWYLVDLPNGRLAWMNPGTLREVYRDTASEPSGRRPALEVHLAFRQ